jgi:phosphatidylglycerophosphatase C
MPEIETPRQAAAKAAQVAAFDFDGTLTTKDTLVPFLVEVHGGRRVAAAWLRASLTAARNGSAGTEPFRDQMKLAAMGALFRGMPEARLYDLGQAYATRLDERLRPDMVDRLRWHQDHGHQVVIVSASLDAYLRPLAFGLGIDGVLAVELLADDAGVLTGAVAGSVNNRGPHKLRRLRAWTETRFGPDTPIELWAYGDSSGDRDLLGAADHPTWIGRRGRSG